jgi:flagellar hook-basal body complex protein FliE
MTNSISSVRILPAELDTPSSRTRPAEGSKFLQTLQQTMDQVQGMQGDAQSKVAELLNGNGADLHSAMIAVEKADLSFQLMMQVRNKIVSAYQEVSRMQF